MATKLHKESVTTLDTVKQEAQISAARAHVAKIKVKALLVLMRKMIAYSVAGKQAASLTACLSVGCRAGKQTAGGDVHMSINALCCGCRVCVCWRVVDVRLRW